MEQMAENSNQSLVEVCYRIVSRFMFYFLQVGTLLLCSVRWMPAP